MRRRRTSLAAFVATLLLVVVFGRNRSLLRSFAVATGATAKDAFVVAPGHAGPCEVLRVVDGDTLHVRIPGSTTPDERIRLLRINTPEKGQPGYQRANTCLRDLTASGEVDLEWEGDQPERDAYGRLLAYVRVGGVLVNLELVRQGFSRFFTKYGEGRLADRFRAAEAEARAANRGLWSDAGFNVAARR